MKQFNRRGFFGTLFAPLLAPALKHLAPKSILHVINEGIRPGWAGFVKAGPVPPGSIVEAGDTIYWLFNKGMFKLKPGPQPRFKFGEFRRMEGNQVVVKLEGIGR